MKWDNKICGVCYEQLKYDCAELDRMEGRNIACEQCMVVNGFLKDETQKFDNDAHQYHLNFLAFIVRVYTAGSNMRNPTLDRRD